MSSTQRRPLDQGRDGAVAVAALIATQRDQHQVPHAVSCRALGVSWFWFCKWRSGVLLTRAQRRQLLEAEVACLFALPGGKYGSPRITAGLRDAGWRVSENTVAGLMAEPHREARRKRRKGTTRSGKGRWQAPDLVRRDFPARQVNRKWFDDGAEIPAAEGKLRLVSVMDVVLRAGARVHPGGAARCADGLCAQPPGTGAGHPGRPWAH
jgi:putative transposase